MNRSPLAREAIPEKVTAFLEKHGCLFHQPWWLDAVCAEPWRWSCVWVERGDDIAAAWPLAYKIRWGFRLIETPPPTPYQGPVLRPSTAKYANRLSEEKDLMSELVAKLPRFALFEQHFHPALTNWLPFYWKGFQQTTRYTYQIRDTADLEAVWEATRDSVRKSLRKARETLKVREEPDYESALALHKLTLSRQGMRLPHPEAFLRRLHAACAARNAGKLLVAEDPSGRPHAFVQLLWDKEMVYYFLGGGDPSLRNSGAASLLIWEGIQLASAMKKGFDFEGSMIEPIERFFRSFGAVQTPYFAVSKVESSGYLLMRSFIRGSGILLRK